MQYIYLNARKDAQDFTKLALILLPRIVLGSIVCPSLFVSGWSVNGSTAGHWTPCRTERVLARFRTVRATFWTGATPSFVCAGRPSRR
jgi:hypothetical protein